MKSLGSLVVPGSALETAIFPSVSFPFNLIVAMKAVVVLWIRKIWVKFGTSLTLWVWAVLAWVLAV
jgi:hypothetical protein